MRGYRLIVVAAAMALGFAAQADSVYRCEDDAGAVSYSDQPCGPLDGGRVAIELDPAVPASPFLEQRERVRAYRRSRGYTPPPARPARPSPPAAARPRVDCPGASAIEDAIRSREVVACMTPAQVRRATPARIANHEVRRNYDENGPFIEWRYRVVTDGWPARIQFRDGRVYGYETLPYRVRD